ncbi:MAG: ChaN family lipoprotein [Thermodesulfobacteriota bacterium]|nr:ChaN family lipoprotein [Thermodesulfobacteriota bacterium]
MPYLMKKGLLYDLEDSFDNLMDYHVIFIGEEHGSPVSRNAERTILKGLAKRDSNLVLALEMFELDVQDILDAYLKGEMSEKTFLKRSRPWPNYLEDYRPLIEFAKKKRMSVIAANIPRRAAAAVSIANKISPDVMGEDKP